MESKITNLSYLNEISGGDKNLILEMILIFNTEVPEYLNRMNQLLADKNFESLGKLAHKAKASASIMGMKDVADELKCLEKLTAEKKEQDKYPSMVNHINTKFRSAIEELKLISKTL